jgi:hypothetical protein
VARNTLNDFPFYLQTPPRASLIAPSDDILKIKDPEVSTELLKVLTKSEYDKYSHIFAMVHDRIFQKAYNKGYNDGIGAAQDALSHLRPKITTTGTFDSSLSVPNG